MATAATSLKKIHDANLIYIKWKQATWGLIKGHSSDNPNESLFTSR